MNRLATALITSAASITLAFTFLAPLKAQGVRIIEHPLYDQAYIPLGIANGPDGALWFTQQADHSIGRITTSGVLTRYPLPGPDYAGAITSGPDNALWFTSNAGIGRITTSGLVTVFPFPTNWFANGITTGPDGAIWFTIQSASGEPGEIGRVTTVGGFTQYVLPSGVDPEAIVSGPDGALWFTDAFTLNIGRITTTGTVTEYAVPGVSSGITPGPDGALWFNEQDRNAIGRITTTGSVTEYPCPEPAGIFGDLGMGGITAGPSGPIWFAGANSVIASVTTSGVFTYYPGAVPAEFLLGVAVGSDGSIWYMDSPVSGSFTIAQVVATTASLSATPASGAPGSVTTLSGTGFAPNETVNIYNHSTGSHLLTTVSADSTGSISMPTNIGPAFSGDLSLVGLGQTSHKLAVGQFEVTSLLTLSTQEALPGATVIATGSSLQPGYAIDLYVNEEFLGSTQVDANGDFKQSFIVPADLIEGDYTVYAETDSQPLAAIFFFAL